jgi:capsular polysaccharide biosynthesis protein
MIINKINLPSTSRIDTFVSPSFTTSAPELINAENLTPKLRDLYAVLWHQVQAEEEIICSIVPDAIVEGPGLVFDRDLNLIQQTIHQATNEEIFAAARQIQHHIQNNLLTTQPGVTLLCEKAGIGNYGHWLIEMLPIAFLNLPHLQSGKWRLRLPVASAAMNAVMRDSVDLIGVPTTQVDVRRPGPQRYEQLVVVHGLSHHGIRYSPRIIDCMKHLATTVPAQTVENVWISRVGDRRSLRNEAGLCEALVEHGWHVAETGRMTLRDQIGLFKGARRIAGVNGAGLTNLVFAAPGIEVTTFMPALMPDVFFWMLAGFKEQHYREVRCEQVEDEQAPGGWNSTLLMDIPNVMAILT